MLLRSVPRVLAGLFVCLAVLLTGCSPTGPTKAPASSARPSWAAGMATVKESQLPAEARQTLARIDRGGPFPYAMDGAVFGNFERLLPRHQRGYYHEYTVKTPGSRDRGPGALSRGRATRSTTPMITTNRSGRC